MSVVESQTCVVNGAAVTTTLGDNGETSESDEDLRWGWGSCRPKCLQLFNSSVGILVILTTCSVAYGMSVNGFNYAAINSLEKRFHFNSKQTGLISSITHASTMIVTLFVSFFGSFGNKPRWLAACTACAGFGLFLFAVPHFMIGKYMPPEVKHASQFCNANVNSTTDVCDGDTTSFGWSYFFVFLLSQMITGAGGAAFFSLGIAYLDENVNPKYMPIFLGIYHALSFVGPSVGFIIAGYLLSTYVDIEQPEGLNLSPQDPRWIGNWWVGSLFAGLVVFLLVPIMLGNPRQLPSTKVFREQAIKNNEIHADDVMISGNIRDIIPATKKLLINPVFMFQTLGVWTQIIMASGASPFLFKLIQLRYGATQALTGLGLGMILTISSIVGTFIGSFFGTSRKLKENCKIAAKYCFIFQIFSLWMCFMFLIPGCDDINLPSPQNRSETSCDCDAVKFMPMCYDKKVYYSPCHAGCPQQNMSKFFSNCSVPQDDGTPAPVLGLCDRNCKNLYKFLVGFAITLICTYFNDIPGKIVSIRSVAQNQRAYALGLQLVLWRVLAAIPAPVVFGSFFDKYCILWRESCGNKGDCLAYDSDKYIMALIIATLICQASGLVFFYLSWHFACKQSFIDREQENYPAKPDKREANGTCVVENGAIEDSVCVRNSATYEEMTSETRL